MAFRVGVGAWEQVDGKADIARFCVESGDFGRLAIGELPNAFVLFAPKVGFFFFHLKCARYKNLLSIPYSILTLVAKSDLRILTLSSSWRFSSILCPSECIRILL